MKDYARAKALAQELIKCIGDEEEVAPAPPGHSEDERGDNGETGICDMDPASDCGVPEEKDGEKHKKRKDDAMALMASTLAAKFSK